MDDFKTYVIVHTDSRGEQWCRECYRFGCAANHCSCACHLHPEGMCVNATKREPYKINPAEYDAFYGDAECNGICLWAADIGVPEAGNVVAYAHPDCPEHGDPVEDSDKDVCAAWEAEGLRYVREEDVAV